MFLLQLRQSTGFFYIEITSVSLKIEEVFKNHEDKVKMQLAEYFQQNLPFWKIFLDKNVMKCIERTKK